MSCDPVLLFAQLHRANFETLRKLMRHLSEVAKNSKTNRMTVSGFVSAYVQLCPLCINTEYHQALNLAMIFGPTLIRPKHDHGMQATMDDHSYQCKVCRPCRLAMNLSGRLTTYWDLKGDRGNDTALHRHFRDGSSGSVDDVPCPIKRSYAHVTWYVWYACHQNANRRNNRIRIAASVPLRKSRIAEQDSGVLKPCWTSHAVWGVVSHLDFAASAVWAQKRVSMPILAKQSSTDSVQCLSPPTTTPVQVRAKSPTVHQTSWRHSRMIGAQELEAQGILATQDSASDASSSERDE